MQTYSEMNKEELINAAKQWEQKHHVGCTVYQTESGDAGLQWNAQQSLPSDTAWFHVQGAQDVFSE